MPPLCVSTFPRRANEHYLATLVDRWRASSHCIVASTYDGELGVPALFPRDLGEELRASGGDLGAKAVIRRHLDRTLRFECPAAAFDVDTEADYVRLCEPWPASRS